MKIIIIYISETFFEAIYPRLKLNLVTGNVVNFLDLNISFDYDFQLLINLFIKPTNTQSYLMID